MPELQPLTVSGAGSFSIAKSRQRARIPPERARVAHAWRASSIASGSETLANRTP
jgi:hypothetical protein